MSLIVQHDLFVPLNGVVTSQNVVKLLQLASREDYKPRRFGHIYDIYRFPNTMLRMGQDSM